MGRPALAPAAIDAFRDRLCDAALRRFAEDGYRGVTLRGLARELGVSHAMAYRYFVDKDAIFVECRRRCLARFTAYQRARLDGITDPAAAIRAGARSYVDFAIDEPHAFRVMFDLEQPAPASQRALRDAQRGAFDVLGAVVRRAVTAGVLRGEPAELTQMFWASIHGVASLHVGGQLGRRRTAHAVADAIATTMLAGLAPGPREAR
ncbi:MAG: TetR/AcrR family transcriptional regulator [Kofleriaceae bacterium]|nr:TetR/AcrR family transcriptional regulator [Kofleriaceae bacterium]MCB9573391.1 TetR/AcrR family transcriptional regulator [Kofleriaceae bacterium]